MKFIHYLQAKYRQKYPTTCKRFEAKLFGIPYPLESGWLLTYGYVDVDAQKLTVLEQRLQRVVLSGAPGAEWAERGLKAIKRAQVIDRSLAITSEGIPYLTDDWDRAVRSIMALSRQACGECGIRVEQPAVKHRLDIAALFLDFDNLILLCEPCGAMWDALPRNPQGEVIRRAARKPTDSVEVVS